MNNMSSQFNEATSTAKPPAFSPHNDHSIGTHISEISEIPNWEFEKIIPIIPLLPPRYSSQSQPKSNQWWNHMHVSRVNKIRESESTDYVWIVTP